ncbi:diguanylate cyclase [Sulfurimonas aquatica]|uniref:diguanylate cyclase n=1 Tax=Sulfurimonas aquatica TaxID=2672570 RepID=A0A975GCS8_9BACT|nr:GGDEF domain-containing protein [Sulfurimonas aquatica]QSZ42021.1 diguanylate cyclase [Sulfurimonas aquatica]
MQETLQMLVQNFDIIGLLLIMTALISVRKIILELPEGQVLRKWKILSLVIILFIGGYLHVIYQHRFGDGFASETVVSTLLLGGAIFVLMISMLSLETTRDIRRIDVLEYENSTDSLMNIRNRRHLDERVKEEFAKFEHFGVPFSVLMIDVDHFKKINDNYGHDIGDEVLRTLGQGIKNYVRDGDCVARYGGEELVVVCPSTSEEASTNLAERLRQFIEKMNIVDSQKHSNVSDLHITVSIGVAECSSDFKEAHEVIKCADNALYIAKNEGRNRVVCCGENKNEMSEDNIS